MPTDASEHRPLAERIREKEERGEKYIAFEYFPPRTDDGVQNLYERFHRMKAQNPLYADITWGAGGSTSELTVQIARKMQEAGFETNMHLTCTNMEEEKVTTALKELYEAGIRNICALRGDPPKGQEEWKATEGGFTCALDLVKHIKKLYGDYFNLSVAGYPEGHPNVIKEVENEDNLSEEEKGRLVVREGKKYVCSDEDYKGEMDYLKKKVDAGAGMIITQMHFDTDVFLKFVKDCRKWGINVPVIPGLMLIQNYGGFCRMTDFCRTRVPQWIWDRLEPIKDDPDEVRAAGVEIGTRMCKELFAGGVHGIHFYSLNLEKVTYGILNELGMYNPVEGCPELPKSKPGSATPVPAPAEKHSISGEAAAKAQ